MRWRRPRRLRRRARPPRRTRLPDGASRPAANRPATRTTSPPSVLSCSSTPASRTRPSSSKTRAAVGMGTTYGTSHARSARVANSIVLIACRPWVPPAALISPITWSCRNGGSRATEHVQPVERVLERPGDRPLVHRAAPEHPVGRVARLDEPRAAPVGRSSSGSYIGRSSSRRSSSVVSAPALAAPSSATCRAARLLDTLAREPPSPTIFRVSDTQRQLGGRRKIVPNRAYALASIRGARGARSGSSKVAACCP